MKNIIYFILLLSLSSSAQVFNTSLMTRPITNNPTLITNVTSLSGFSTVPGAFSASQSFTLSGSNLTANATITAPANYEVSLDNTSFSSTVTAVQSGGSLTGQPVTIYVRITSSSATGTVSGNVTITSAGAVTKNISVTGNVSAGSPTLSSSVTSLSAFSTTVGNPSAQQNFTISGNSLTASATITAPTGFELSLDNVSYATSKSVSQSGGQLTGQPVSIYTRIAGSTSVGSYSGNIVISSTGATSINVAVSGTVNSASTGKDSVRVQLLITAAFAQSGWTILQGGDPVIGVITATGGNNNTITISTIATANWYSAGGHCAAANNGTVNGTVWNYAPNVMKEEFYQYITAYNSALPQIQIGGLKTSSNYKIQLTGSVASNISPYNCTGEYRIKGSTLLAVQTLNNQPSGVENKTGSLTFPGTGDGSTLLVPDSSGNIFIYFNAFAGSSFGSLCAFILKEQ